MNLNKLERYLRVNLLGPGPRLIKKRIYWAAVSQMLRNTTLYDGFLFVFIQLQWAFLISSVPCGMQNSDYQTNLTCTATYTQRIIHLLHVSALLECHHEALHDDGTQEVPKHAVDGLSFVCTLQCM
jgi:hypothetical protein